MWTHTTLVPSDSMIRRVHAVSAIGFTVLGLSLNGLLLWMIPRCNDDDEKMRTYSRILSQISLTDIAFLVTSALTQYVRYV